MDKRLETYLQTVETELGALEAEQRDSELREMRQHIEAIVARLVEGGLSENEAVEAAIAQFGAARQVGRELQKASVQNESPLYVAAAVAAAGVVVVYVGLGSLFQATQGALGMAAWLIPVVLGTLVSFAAGAFAGFIAPKRGGRAALWALGTGGLFVASLVFLSIQSIDGDTTTEYFSFLMNSTYLLAQMAVMWRGANFGARRAQSCNLTRA